MGETLCDIWGTVVLSHMTSHKKTEKCQHMQCKINEIEELKRQLDELKLKSDKIINQ